MIDKSDLPLARLLMKVHFMGHILGGLASDGEVSVSVQVGDAARLADLAVKQLEPELDEIVRTGRVWLMVVGDTMPPVSLQGFKPAMQKS